jgi:hypothetical protein
VVAHTEGVEGGTIAIVPARRLAQLLAEARRDHDERLTEVAARSGGRFSTGDLLALEAGTFELDDEVVRDALAAYDVDPGVLSPERSRLVIDLDHRRLRAGEHEQRLGAPTADEVLTTYLSLVYTMRHAEPGTPVALRDADISVLSRVLELTSGDVTERLVHLMEDPDELVTRRHRWLRRRVLVPAAGIVIAATAIGAVVLVNSSGDAATVPVTTTVPVASTPDVSLIPPVVQGRNPDGSPGPQVTLEDVQIGDAIVMGRNPDGSAGPQVTR